MENNASNSIVYLGLGSNLGSRFVNLTEAINRLREKAHILDISSIEETEPVGFAEQPKFLNCVVQVETAMSPQTLLAFVKAIERDMGRVKGFKNGPRLIDIDILFYGDRVIDEGSLRIPHPDAALRGFVLKPMSELAPDYVHPVLRRGMAELYDELERR